MVRGSVFSIVRISSNFKRLLFILAAFGLIYFALITIFSSPTSEVPGFSISYSKFNSISQSKSISNSNVIDPAEPQSSVTKLAKNDDWVPLAEAVLQQNEAEKSLSDKPLCPSIEENKQLLGHVPQGGLLIEDLSEKEVLAANPSILPGGRWKPEHCVSKKKVAVVIPYRDRYSHLVRLLNFLFPILQRQLLDFRFIVTEQYGDDLFNKGRIMNAAFRLAEKLNVDCVIFHDVDMFPQDDRTPYDCPEQPRHIGAFVSNLGYQLWYNELVGGVLAMTMDDYRTINGYSNLYWAWGGEDDDMGKRILSQNMTIERPNQEYARYSMLKHGKRKRTAPKLIYKLLESAGTRWETDGVNETGLWNVVNVDLKPLYYHLMVDVGTPPEEWRAEQ